MKRSRATQDLLTPDHLVASKKALQRVGKKPQVQVAAAGPAIDGESMLSTGSGAPAAAARGGSVTAASLADLLAAAIRHLPLANCVQLDQWLALYRLFAAHHTGKPLEKVA